jgi:membrane associated rhomboid family serine protease
MDAPSEEVVAPQPVAVAPRSFPWLTAAIIVVLVAIFAAEVRFDIGGGDGQKRPSILTLIAFGGLMGKLVMQSGEWYRLLVAPLLHGSALHITVNAAAIGLAGYMLEPLIGRAWFAALFVLGALSGALMSLMTNPDDIVSVGASGAGMALFSCMLALSWHFPKGGMRIRLRMWALYLLIPSLLPFSSAAKDIRIDYSAHVGGALGGALVGVVLLDLWSANDIRPRLRVVAGAIAVAGLAAILIAGAFAQRNFAVYDLGFALAPRSELPTTDEAALQQSADLIVRYPRDPRVQFIYAMTLLTNNDRAGAEKALRAALAEEAVWRRALTGSDVSERLHGVLALVLQDRGRRDEAIETAKPACMASTLRELRNRLDQAKLC